MRVQRLSLVSRPEKRAVVVGRKVVWWREAFQATREVFGVRLVSGAVPLVNKATRAQTYWTTERLR